MTDPMARQIYPHLWRHPNQTWYIVYDRKNRKSLQTRDKTAAAAFFQELRKEAHRQKLTVIATGCQPVKLVDFWEEYQEYRFKTARPMTCQTDKQAFRVFRQALGDETHLFKITRKQLEKELASLGKRVSPVSANTWFRHFKAALSKAVKWGYLQENPAKDIKLLRHPGANRVAAMGFGTIIGPWVHHHLQILKNRTSYPWRQAAGPSRKSSRGPSVAREGRSSSSHFNRPS